MYDGAMIHMITKAFDGTNRPLKKKYGYHVYEVMCFPCLVSSIGHLSSYNMLLRRSWIRAANAVPFTPTCQIHSRWKGDQGEFRKHDDAA